MKRPTLFYFVVAWCFFTMRESYLTRPAKAYWAAGESVPVLWAILPVIALGFVVWQAVGLVRLKAFHRWFSVVFFSWRSLTLAWNGISWERKRGSPIARFVFDWTQNYERFQPSLGTQVRLKTAI